jgi:ketosteroid isomerase-like protein
VPATAQEIFERYIWTGITQNADARADLYAEDGVYEAPLVPAGGVFPRRVEGREEIRTFQTALNERSDAAPPNVNVEESRYVLHTTADPDVFIAEMDIAMTVAGDAVTTSLVHIYRIRDGKIALLRDYFGPEHLD